MGVAVGVPQPVLRRRGYLLLMPSVSATPHPALPLILLLRQAAELMSQGYACESTRKLATRFGPTLAHLKAPPDMATCH